MIILQEQLIQLSRIYNTLLTIETKGENTLTMAECIRALQQLIQEIQSNPVSAETGKIEN